jgi:hypothetical protein
MAEGVPQKGIMPSAPSPSDRDANTQGFAVLTSAQFGRDPGRNPIALPIKADFEGETL